MRKNGLKTTTRCSETFDLNLCNNNDSYDVMNLFVCVCVFVCMVKLCANWETAASVTASDRHGSVNQNRYVLNSSRTSYWEWYLNRCLCCPWMMSLPVVRVLADTFDDVESELVDSMDRHFAVNKDIQFNNSI